MNNTYWQILAIAPTTDERAIKRAYAKQLKTLDPDDRNAFIALREAYENALDWASWQDEDEDAPPFAETAAAPTPYPSDADMDTLDAQAPESDDDGYVYDDYEAYDDYDEGGIEGGFADAFVAQCWESWQMSDSEKALLALLEEQHNTLQEKDISTSIEYTDALLQWFYHSENHAPQAFSRAAQLYRWGVQNSNWYVQELIERYPESQYPQFSNYPALIRWDENWHKGFWARLAQLLHPIERAQVGEELARYRWEKQQAQDQNQDKGGELPPSFHSFSNSRRLYWLAWLMSVPVAAAYSSDPAGLGRYLLAIMLFYGAFLWSMMVGKSWRQPALRTEWSASSLFFSLLFLLFLCIALLALDNPSDSQSFAGVSRMLSVSGAVFAACFLRRVALPPAIRGHFTSSLLYGALLLPFFAFILDNRHILAHSALFYWLFAAYTVLSAAAIAINPNYRRWDYIAASLAAVVLFLLFVLGVLPPAALLAVQISFWLVMPFVIQLAPRLPRVSYLLSDTLRALGQNVLAFCLPAYLWHCQWYVAFAASLLVAVYLLWLDAEIDEAAVAARLSGGGQAE